MFSHGSSVINEFYSWSSPLLACGLWCIRFCCVSTCLSSTRYDSAPTVRNIQREVWLWKLSSSVSGRHESKMLNLITSSTVLFWLPFQVHWLETLKKKNYFKSGIQSWLCNQLVLLFAVVDLTFYYIICWLNLVLINEKLDEDLSTPQNSYCEETKGCWLSV